MGTNVIHLVDWAVPSYLRSRGNAAYTSASTSTGGTWTAMARHRAAQRQLAEHIFEPGAQSAAQPAAAQPRALSLVPRGTAAAGPTATAPVVRVTHLVDAPQLAGGGRLRISGRLIDVCAELDRLAAAEAQAALPRRA